MKTSRRGFFGTVAAAAAATAVPTAERTDADWRRAPSHWAITDRNVQAGSMVLSGDVCIGVALEPAEAGACVRVRLY